MTRVSIPKLAAAGVAPLKSDPKYISELLQSTNATWPQDVSYMRDIYEEIRQKWIQFEDPSQDSALYEAVKTGVAELVQGLKDVSQQRSGRADLYRVTERAGHDAQTGELYGKSGDYNTAVVMFSYAMTKIHAVLESLTLEGKKRKASLLIKKGYGYDISGEVQNGSGSRNEQKHQWDSANPQKQHDTGVSPSNVMRDTQAENEFPELKQKKKTKIHFPARTD